MYEYIPKRENRKAMHIIGVLMLGGVGVLALTSLFETIPFRWVFQLVGIGGLLTAIFLYTRYIAKLYCYRVVACDDGTLDFLVDEMQGKRRLTVCRIGVERITRVETIHSEEKERRDALKKQSRAEGRHRFDYCPDLAPARVSYLFVEEGGEPMTIAIVPDDRLLEILAPSETKE